ncbi:glycogen debranching N-terminal domain-containing protein [Paenarthrobacter sp. RAF54_2]|uniref:glycogen debranching N-terminal domain-containing protein n=1 Tax=Paenarthrobacter sp. RAF54_2 TaxID=3233061 RepID=UPI003F982258
MGAGIPERITLRNYSTFPARCRVSLRVEADFADLFEVKEARFHRRWDESREATAEVLTIGASWQDIRKHVVISAPGAESSPDGIAYRIVVPPHGFWSTRMSVAPGAHAQGQGAQFIRRTKPFWRRDPA